ncbi:lysozyme inhibitor LprI family protein [Methylovulum psychrotolerans]|uniref:Lysozyme inhibitor LprI-like N-terminal domain-containing protein n=1 Tax=Methylovulum psychrotolerans TaxID=1704499 RepID=A0A2S5CGT1_9GAMM|nr:lysozyme inhibitor LprI family protein [Methylovulum psychrotolerans]POZ50023.1 hypothetical protein AADEFJLK_04147 [Methylovulum psychrotolerans]
MNIKHLTPLLLSSLLLSACDKQTPEASCSSEAAYTLISQTIIDAVEKKTSDEKYTDTGEFIFDKAKIRASLGQLQIAVESVRTTKEDPNSSKKFCSGVLKVTIPASMLADADQAKGLQNKSKISEDARELDIDNNINVFTKKDFEYSVQPTDDGKELYVESENTLWVSLLNDIASSALLKPILEVKKAEQIRQNAQEKQEVENLKQEAEASKLEAERLSALQEKQEADQLKQDLLAKQAVIAPEQSADNNQMQQQEVAKYKAKDALDEANKQINIVWKSATKNTRAVLLSEQRKWLKQRENECERKASIEEPDNSIVQETIKLYCMAAMTNERTDTLKQKIASIP